MWNAPTCIISHHPTAIPIFTYQYAVVKFQLFHIQNHIGIKLLYEAFQLKKVHQTKSAKDGTYVEDVTSFYKYHILEITVTKPRCMAS